MDGPIDRPTQQLSCVHADINESIATNHLSKLGHRHKSCALVKQNVKILKNFQKLSKPLKNFSKTL